MRALGGYRPEARDFPVVDARKVESCRSAPCRVRDERVALEAAPARCCEQRLSCPGVTSQKLCASAIDALGLS